MNFGFILVLLFASFAQAYIPPADMILKKNTQINSGSGFRVTLKVQIENDPAKLAFQEVWTIKDAETMRVQIHGLSQSNRNYYEDYIYKEGKRYRINESGELAFIDTNSDHFEGFYHMQTLEGARRFLTQAEVLPPTEIKPIEESSEIEGSTENPIEANAVIEKKEFIYKPDPFVRLGRFSGKVAYVFGKAKPHGSSEAYPGLWVEQDRFRTLKLRLPSGVEILSSDYKSMGKRTFSGKRSLVWRGQKILLTTQRLERIVVGPKTRRFLQPGELLKSRPSRSFTSNEDEGASISLSATVLNEFYQRFR